MEPIVVIILIVLVLAGIGGAVAAYVIGNTRGLTNGEKQGRERLLVEQDEAGANRKKAAEQEADT